MKITKNLIETMRNDINEALKAVGEKYGLVLEAGNASFNETCADFKLKATDPVENWKQNVAHTGLRPDDYGKLALFGKQKLKIVGFDRTARTNKVQLIDPATGKRYHASVSETISALNALDPARAGLQDATAEQMEAAKEKEFEVKAFMCGLKGRVSYGQTFEWDGCTYRIVDLNPKAPKYPIIAEHVNPVLGGQYKFTKDVLPAKEGAV